MNIQVAYYELLDMFLALRQLYSGERFKPFNRAMSAFEDKLTVQQHESLHSYGILTNGYLAALRNLLSMKLTELGSDDTHLMKIVENPQCLFLSEADQINDERIISEYDYLLENYQSDTKLIRSIRNAVADLWKGVFSTVKAQHSTSIYNNISQLNKTLNNTDAIGHLSSLSDRFYIENDTLHFQIKPPFSIRRDEIENIIIMPSLYSTRDLTFWYENNNLIFFLSLESDSSTKTEPSDMLLLITSALNDRSRLKLLKLLYRNNCTAGDLARELKLNASTVSRHLKIFKDAGFIDILSNDGKKIVYTLNNSAVDSSVDILKSYLTEGGNK